MTTTDPWQHVAALWDGPSHWQPQPKQAKASALARQVDELLYGGARGGGKTEWLVQHLAAVCERHAGVRAMVVRREFPSLEETILPRCRLLLVATGRARERGGNPTTYHFPNGSVLVCRSVVDQRKVDALRGAEYAVIGFEELTEFDRGQYEELIATVRTTIPGVRPHVVATTNPGGRGHRWVKRRFVKPRPEDAATGERPVAGTRWRPRPSVEQPNPGVRCFLPATMDDNPRLMQVDPGYRDRVRAQSNRGLRKAMEHGDWDAIDAVEGALWSTEHLDAGRVHGRFDPQRGLLVAPVEDVVRRVVSVDPSDGEEWGDGYGVCVVARGADGVGYVEFSAEWRAQPRELAEKTVDVYHRYGCWAVVVERNHGGKWLPTVFSQVERAVNIRAVWASEGKMTRAEPVAALFTPSEVGPLPYRARMVGYHEDLEDELTTFTGEPGQPSPNRLDALVWGLADLMLRPQAGPVGQVRDRRLAVRR